MSASSRTRLIRATGAVCRHCNCWLSSSVGIETRISSEPVICRGRVASRTSRVILDTVSPPGGNCR
ncbi:hypothetical protein R2601_04293 [Salipiger bermudensis HTCC2601]|uniref:Uncharacterized protein n=1 Tax=Salipiger bermudensis (strain DSM 26914 / JCM 13377 / KCTC 12554 / HTCC2601) TaxID=314265 RepID=Q0FVY7_SALBH|nr:hypothetical protein R2601_04293 [Salipiger bermudensis HTCC2601]